ncbi:hypothetical protein RI367_004037 [Sorochytrium milnesiophthora]
MSSMSPASTSPVPQDEPQTPRTPERQLHDEPFRPVVNGNKGNVGEAADAVASMSLQDDTEVDEDALRELFERFCAFGQSRSSQNSLMSPPKPTPALAAAAATIAIDNARYVKFFKDLHLTSKTLTTTDLDIIFNKCKANKADRKLDFNAFKLALLAAAERKYTGANMDTQHAYAKLVNEALRKGAHGPEIHGTIPDASGIYSKLTDTSKYTGTQKERFANITPSGSQNNLSSTSKLSSSRKSSNALGGTSSKFSGSTAGLGSTSKLSSTGGGLGGTSTKFGSTNTLGGKTGKTPVTSPSRSGSASNLLGSADFKPTVPVIKEGSVFDRLTRPSGYTGRHKQTAGDAQK